MYICKESSEKFGNKDREDILHTLYETKLLLPVSETVYHIILEGKSKFWQATFKTNVFSGKEVTIVHVNHV